ncbi:MAG TPA: methyl-accepting chemotaxis protein [Sphingomonas sp.]|jgi:methyl-accepting chemotaxis protein|uniref:methyl-accepting chemotaxis protein n=1 Tax=Sphingomonas sp. TaxID=28214 RepID=UPI002ED83B00
MRALLRTRTAIFGRRRRLGSSIAAKLVLATAAVALGLFALLSSISYLGARNAVQGDVERDMVQVGKATASQISDWFDGRRLLVELTNDIVARVPDGQPREGALRQRTVTDTFEEVYFGAEADGKFSATSIDNKLPDGYDPRKRPWYIDALRQRGATLTKPYSSAGTRGLVVTLAVPLYKKGVLQGVTGSDFTISTVAKLVQQISLDHTGYAFLVDDAGVILVHKDKALVGKSLSAIFDGVTPPVSESTQTANAGGRAKLIGFTPIAGLPSRHWYVCIVVDEAAVHAGLNASYLRSALSAALITLASLGILWIIASRMILKPLHDITDIMHQIARGRLDIVIDRVDRHDEIGAMARAVEVFRNNAIQVAGMAAADERRTLAEAENRAAMMAQLKSAFGRVVDAASEGDFTKRVSGNFRDAELNDLALSVNTLVSTVDRGLTETGGVLSALAQTDLTRRIDGDYRGAFATLKQDVNAVADRLTAVVQQLRQMSQKIRLATVELLDGATRLAERTDRQAAAIHGTSVEAQQITAIVRENADSTETARYRANAASESAGEGGQVMATATAAMERIDDSSSTVLTIVDVIDDIAAQTTLVALNASIEAARAGDNGRSFSVVANEVRRLAQRATDASTEVKTLIEQSRLEVRNGSAMVSAAAEALRTMLQAFRDNSALLDTIADASRRESQSLETINGTIGQMDALTRDSASLARQFAGITKQAEAHASELDAIVDLFTLRHPSLVSAAA